MKLRSMFPVFLAFGAMLILASLASGQTYVDENRTIVTPTYEIWGPGQNYDTGGGVYAPSDPTIVNQAGEWRCDTTSIPWRVVKADQTLYITRGGKELGLRPAGIYYVNRTDLTQRTLVAAAQAPTPTLNAESIYLDNGFVGVDVDMELLSRPGGPIFDYIVNSKTGFPASPYPAGDTWVVFAHRIVGADLPSIDIDGQAPNWATGTAGDTIAFRALKDWYIVPSEARSSDSPLTPDDVYAVKNFLVDIGGNDYFLEGVPYSWFLGKTFPVRLHYETQLGGIVADTTWTTGTTYCLQQNTPIGQGASQNTLTIEEGVFVKFSDVATLGSMSVTQLGGLDVNGTVDNPVYFVSCNDDSVGEDVWTCGGACNDTTAAAADWENLNFQPDGGTGIDLDYFIMKHCGAGFRECFSFNSTLDDLTTIDDFIATDFHDSSNTFSGLIITQAFSNNPIVYVRGGMVLDGTAARQDELIYMSVSSGSGEFYIENNLFVIPGTGSDEIMYLYDNNSATKNVIRNNTIACTGADTFKAFNFRAFQASDIVQNNISYGCDSAFVGIALWAGTGGYNTAYDYTSAWTSPYVQSTGDDTTDPVMTEHVETSWVPTWADDYHIGTSSPDIDGGTGDATTLGLHTRHAISDGTLDSGTADKGFHFIAGSGSGSGGDPPGGGNPGPGDTGNPWTGGSQGVWDPGNTWGLRWGSWGDD